MISQLGPRFVTAELTGRAGDELLPAMLEGLEGALSVEKVVMYWDIFRLVSFSSSFRSRATEYVLRGRKNIETFALLSDSALIAMAVTATNLALGGILSSYRDRDKFFADRQAAAERHGIELDKLAG